MSQQTVCDSCHEPIDQTEPFIRASVHQVFMTADGTLTVGAGGEAQTFDFHVEHAPETIQLKQPEPAPEPQPTEQPTVPVGPEAV